MRLMLLRHGEAAPALGPGLDSSRELTAYGRQQVLSAAEHLRTLGPFRVLCSPYVRARQTTAQLQEAGVVHGEPLLADWLTPDEPVQAALRQLDALGNDNILLVGHQPLLGVLGGCLVEGSRDAGLPLGTASLAVLEGDYALAGGMRLLALHHARISAT